MRVEFARMKMPHSMTAQEIRVLQEFRRQETKELTSDEISAIRHPFGGGVEPALELVRKGFLLRSDGERFALTEKGVAFLAYNPEP